MADPVRVLIADRSAFVRRAVSRMLSRPGEIEVVGEASTAGEAIALTTRLRPDLVILDVDLPETGGLDALRGIMKEAPTRVMMLSAPGHQGAGITLTALEAGAVDFLERATESSELDIYDIAAELREKVLAVADATLPGPRARISRGPAAPPGADATGTAGDLPPTPPAGCRYDVVAIGASTGGPRALAEVLAQLPSGFAAGVVIAQHMPRGFTRTLADRLHRRSQLEVREAIDGDRITAGTALVAPGGTHVTIERRGKRLRVRVDSGPTDLIHRPSIDRLFHSAAEACGARAIGVVLTGMGDDGSRGLAALREVGSYTIAESEATAIIFGMPRAAAAVADSVVPLSGMAPLLTELCAPDAD